MRMSATKLTEIVITFHVLVKKEENRKKTNHSTIALAVMHASRSTRMRVTVTVRVALFTLRSLRRRRYALYYQDYLLTLNKRI